MKERELMFVFIGIIFAVLGSFVFTVINETTKCPDYKYRAYKYGDKVSVIAGFYKGQKGHITGRKGFYSKKCFVPHFKVNTGLFEHYIPQYDLAVNLEITNE